MSLITKPRHDAPTKAEFYAPKKAASCFIFHRWEWTPMKPHEWRQYASCTRCGKMKSRYVG